MELTTRGRYAVMAMADISAQTASENGSAVVSLSDIAARQMLPIAYLEQLFGKLRTAGLVESVRGRNGGYRLGRPAGDIAIVDILAAVDETTRMTRCSGFEVGGCVAEQRCLTHGLWSALGAHIRGFLAVVTLADVINDQVILPIADASRANGSATNASVEMSS